MSLGHRSTRAGSKSQIQVDEREDPPVSLDVSTVAPDDIQTDEPEGHDKVHIIETFMLTFVGIANGSGQRRGLMTG